MPSDAPDLSPARLEALAERMLDEGNGWGFKAAMVAQEAAATLRALAARVVELEAEVERLREALGDMLDDCEPDRPGAPRLSIREAARAVLNGGDYGA